MIRVLFIFFVIAAVAVLAAWSADHPGGLIIHWQNWEVQTSLVLGIVAVLVLLICVLIVYRVITELRAVPGSVTSFFGRRRQAKGLDIITRGLIAVAAGDMARARKYALSAQGGAGHPALARLLGAQAAQLSGDEAQAETCFQAMLEAPETKILGLRGLLAHATARGDTESALGFAAQAFALQPNSSWAFEALLGLQTGAGRWQEALATLSAGARSGLIPADAARRTQAVLLTARARQVLEGGDPQEAERLSLKAFRLLPTFTPAALLAARLMQDKGNRWKAAGVLEEAWRAAPHPALVEAYSALESHEPAHARAKRLSGLAEMKPDDAESRLLLARQAMNTRDWNSARSALAPLVERAPTARVCTLMGEIEQEEHGDIGAAREWLARAVSAPPEPDWVRERFDFNVQDWAHLARDLAAPGAMWPPRIDPALFAHGADAAGPFADVVRAPATPADTMTEEGYEARSVPVVVTPVPGPAPAVPGRDTAGSQADAAGALRSKNGGPVSLRSVRSVRTPRFRISLPRPSTPAPRPLKKVRKFGFRSRRESETRAAALMPDRVRRTPAPPVYHGMAADVPPPPDDPGTDFDGDM